MIYNVRNIFRLGTAGIVHSVKEILCLVGLDHIVHGAEHGLDVDERVDKVLSWAGYPDPGIVILSRS